MIDLRCSKSQDKTFWLSTFIFVIPANPGEGRGRAGIQD
jgi:hypothetical protein